MMVRQYGNAMSIYQMYHDLRLGSTHTNDTLTTKLSSQFFLDVQKYYKMLCEINIVTVYLQKR